LGNFDSSATANEYWPSALDLLHPSENTLDSWHDLADYENLYRPQSLFESQPSFEFPQPASANARWDILSPTRFPETGDYGASPLDVKSRSCPKILLRALLHEAAQHLPKGSMTGDFGKQSHPDDVLDSLFSLLPENSPHENSEHNFELAFKEGDSGIFYRALFYSIANGFAGLTNIPPGAILKMLRQGDMSSRLIEWINSCPHIQAKCLADNLFRAAVEACDEDAVMLVLKATDGTPSAIEPNQIVCKLVCSNRKYTPIELAAKLRHLGIVNKLLAANVDVNKTYGQQEYRECGALELAIRKYGDFEAVDVKLVQNILRFGAEVRVGLLAAAIRWGQAEVIDELVTRFPTSSYHEYFGREGSIPGTSLAHATAHYLGNEHATRLIKRFFGNCRIDTCNCSAVHAEELEEILSQAARRGNIELVKFLLTHTKRTVGLAGAVKSGNRELIELLLSHGATVGEKSSTLQHLTLGNTGYEIRTTPLAEAIRSQNTDLVIEFETLGALSYLDRREHLQAAIISAVEIGDCNYLQRLLQRVPAAETQNWSLHLRLPLIIALQNDKLEAALMLLDNGAAVNEPSDQRQSFVLLEALRTKNKEVVNAVLEADFDFRGQSAVMERAALWGDKPIIEDMIAMGGRVDEGIRGAVKARNRNLVDFLVKLDASLGAPAASISGDTPLQAAVVNQDGHMISFLISRGADPADEGAFISAIEKDQNTFEAILKAFSEQYPYGKQGFGGSVLIKAIEKDNTTLLSALLEAKLDTKGFCQSKQQGERVYVWVQFTAVGFAITHRRGVADSLSVVESLVTHGDTNSIVFRKGSGIGADYTTSSKTALILAVETRSEEMVELLLQNNANIHEPARRGLKRTALQRACEVGSFKMVKLLLDRGAKVNEQPAARDGATSLQLAAKSGSIKIAELLLSRGAIVHETPCKVRGYTAFEAAAGNGRLEMMIFLWGKVAGMGFTSEKIERAKRLAISGNHRGCADYIDTLSPYLPFLEAGGYSGSI
jgi:ankyrin repeat protein